MSEYKLKTPKRVEKIVLGTFDKIENSVVNAYKGIESKFVATFLEKVEDNADKEEKQ